MIELGRDSFTVVRAPLVTDVRDNTQYRDWDNATSTVVTKAKVNPFELAEKLNFEINSEREYSRTGLKFYAPAGTSVEYTDRIEYQGRTYAVFGEPQVWTDFEGVQHHVEFVAQLRRG